MIYLTSGGIAFLVVFSQQLLGPESHRNAYLIKSPNYLIFHALCYSLLAIILMSWALSAQFKINDWNCSEYPITTSILFGIMIQSISKMNFYTISHDNKPVHVGPKYLFSKLDKYFKKRITDVLDDYMVRDINELERSNANLSSRDLDKSIYKCLPTSITDIEREAYKGEIAQRTNLFDKLQYFSMQFGKQRLDMLKTQLDSKPNGKKGT